MNRTPKRVPGPPATSAAGQSPSALTRSKTIVARILEQLGAPELLERLVRLTPTDLQSLLLEVYRARAARLDAAALTVARPLTAPSTLDARAMLEIDRVAYAEARGFEAVELSPVAPVGSSHVLGGIDQNNVLAAVRNVEVLADPTEPMALECARRRRTQRDVEVRLCTSQRLLRLQPVDVPGYTPHFRLFALCTAGRDRGSHAFEAAALAEHVAFYLRFFRALAPLGYRFDDLAVEIADTDVARALGVDEAAVRETVRAHRPGAGEPLIAGRGLPHTVDDPRDVPLPSSRALFERLHAQLAALRAEARVTYDLWRLEGASYYRRVCFRISATAPSGARYPLADGGAVDWTARLLSDGKERLFTSGIGSELIAKLYK
jgi:hypothetical protein